LVNDADKVCSIICTNKGFPSNFTNCFGCPNREEFPAATTRTAISVKWISDTFLSEYLVVFKKGILCSKLEDIYGIEILSKAKERIKTKEIGVVSNFLGKS